MATYSDHEQRRLDQQSGAAMDRAQRISNARLIAAAPKLLQAVSGAFHALKAYQYGNVSTDLAEEVASFCAAAIIEATGEPPPGAPKQAMMLPKTERLRSPRHLAWVRTLPCSVPGCKGGKIEAHHVRKGAGTALKPGDAFTVPLCFAHHYEGGNSGWRSFEVRYGVDLSAIAARLWVESNRERKAEP
jgi:hypothetical protein